ncbi:MAG: ATP phosphoribosyltransferase [Planctomycetota bacterium]|jgi:ATP phosphoribosyltransferase|nr:ATP phosphoribosyltransferase [Planctomycetota bacterium]MDA1202564.1 ATP phosphoribosyltransferase [Planctomycetota bacterium]
MSDQASEWLLRIGVPSKGRLSELASALLADAGLSFRRTDRNLFARCKDVPVEITFLRTDDIPVLAAEGAIGLGITGADLVAESGAEVIHRLDLGVGHCRLALCVPDDSTISDVKQLAGRRIATSFPRVTRGWLADRGVTDAHFVELSGSVEVMITLGVADAIVDLVETGSTLAANRLRILDEIGRYETVLVQDPKLAHPELADRIVRRLEGIVIARGWSLLEYNVPRARLADAEAITPGVKSPTIMALEDPDWCAVRAMVRRGEAHAIIEQLEAIGAVAMIETRIANCRL